MMASTIYETEISTDIAVHGLGHCCGEHFSPNYNLSGIACRLACEVELNSTSQASWRLSAIIDDENPSSLDAFFSSFHWPFSPSLQGMFAFGQLTQHVFMSFEFC